MSEFSRLQNYYYWDVLLRWKYRSLKWSFQEEALMRCRSYEVSLFLFTRSHVTQKYNTQTFLIARLARSDPRNRFSVLKTLSSIYSIFVHFTMFSFRVLTCSRIVSIRIILILNKFRHVWESYESSQFVSYWIWTSLDMFEHVQTCLRIVTIRIILNLNKFRRVWICSDMFENGMNHNNSYDIESEQV